MAADRRSLRGLPNEGEEGCDEHHTWCVGIGGVEAGLPTTDELVTANPEVASGAPIKESPALLWCGLTHRGALGRSGPVDDSCNHDHALLSCSERRTLALGIPSIQRWPRQ